LKIIHLYIALLFRLAHSVSLSRRLIYQSLLVSSGSSSSLPEHENLQNIGPLHMKFAQIDRMSDSFRDIDQIRRVDRSGSTGAREFLHWQTTSGFAAEYWGPLQPRSCCPFHLLCCFHNCVSTSTLKLSKHGADSVSLWRHDGSRDRIYRPGCESGNSRRGRQR